jgi:ubiquinol-cytochrome c reductase iron-sulfur subunit
MSNGDVDKSRRRFLTAATTVVGGAGTVALAVPFVSYWQPSARALAAGAPVEADFGKLEPGQMLRVEWRGKPVWIVRRTTAMLESVKSLDSEVSDPDSELEMQPSYCKNQLRSIKDEYFVAVGICTHLGCSPTYMPTVGDSPAPDWRGGFFCPCHGSKFDLAGRVYAGVPAPSNLEIPPHFYTGETSILIGKDKEAG